MKKHRDRIPTPGQVERDLLDHAADLFGELTEAEKRRVRAGPLNRAYRWAYPASLSPTKGESSQTGPAVADDGSVPGSTASVAAAKEPMRKTVADSARKIDAMRTDSRAVLDSLDRAMNRLSPQGYEPGVPFKPKLSPKELRPLEEAQQRREERNEGYGEG